MSAAIEFRQQLAKTIKATATYYGRSLEPEVLTMMCDDLADLDAGKCMQAYANYRRNPRNKTFPLPAQIRELVNPEQFVSAEAKAREIAARIVGAIPKYGWNNGREAQVYIGPEGWAAVQRAGGWQYLCENVGVGIHATTLQAQLRDQLEGSLHYGRGAIEQAIGVGTRESKAPQLESASDILKRIVVLNKPDSGPDGAA
jgi:hypothetical protein